MVIQIALHSPFRMKFSYASYLYPLISLSIPKILISESLRFNVSYEISLYFLLYGAGNYNSFSSIKKSKEVSDFNI